MKLSDYKSCNYAVPYYMNQWQLSGQGFDNLSLIGIFTPKLKPNEILFRVDSNSLCASDYKIISLGNEHPRIKKFNIDLERIQAVLGHEMAITVMEVGKDVIGRFKTGQRYAVQADLRETGEAVGYNIQGGLQQFGIFGSNVYNYLIPIPDNVGFSQASLTEPPACVYHAYDPRDVQRSDKILWVMGGAGPMGKIHIDYLLRRKQKGELPSFNRLIITEMEESRLKQAEKEFLEKAKGVGIKLDLVNLKERSLDKFFNGSKVDYAVCCVPPNAAQAVLDYFKYIKEGGTVQLFSGFSPTDSPRIDINGSGSVTLGEIHYNEMTVRYNNLILTGTTGSSVENMQSVMDDVANGQIETNDYVAGIGGLKFAKEGLKVFDSENHEGKQRFPGKIVIYPQFFDLPLSRVDELASQEIDWGSLKEEIKAGRWSKTAEYILFEYLLSK